jgi:hypothetical protein
MSGAVRNTSSFSSSSSYMVPEPTPPQTSSFSFQDPSMASSSPASTTIPLMPVSEKLVRGNHTVWKVQVVAALRGAQLYGFLDGTSIKPAEQIKAKVGSDEEDVPNPTFVVWKA